MFAVCGGSGPTSNTCWDLAPDSLDDGRYHWVNTSVMAQPRARFASTLSEEGREWFLSGGEREEGDMLDSITRYDPGTGEREIEVSFLLISKHGIPKF